MYTYHYIYILSREIFYMKYDVLKKILPEEKSSLYFVFFFMARSLKKLSIHFPRGICVTQLFKLKKKKKRRKEYQKMLMNRR